LEHSQDGEEDEGEEGGEGEWEALPSGVDMCTGAYPIRLLVSHIQMLHLWSKLKPSECIADNQKQLLNEQMHNVILIKKSIGLSATQVL